MNKEQLQDKLTELVEAFIDSKQQEMFKGEFINDLMLKVDRYLSDIVPEEKYFTVVDTGERVPNLAWNECRKEILRRIKEKSL